MPVEETKAVARLPNLDVEIWHRRLPEEQAEQLAISLKATPSFDAFARVLDVGPPLSPWLAFNPWLAWFQMTQRMWRPWLEALSAANYPAARNERQSDRS